MTDAITKKYPKIWIDLARSLGLDDGSIPILAFVLPEIYRLYPKDYVGARQAFLWTHGIMTARDLERGIK